MRAALKERTRLIGGSVLLFSFSLFLTAYSAKHPEVGRSGAVLLQSITYPLSSTAYKTSQLFTDALSSYVLLIDVKEDNRKLRSQLTGIAALDARLDELRFENSRLRKMLGMEQPADLNGIIAQVIAFDPSNWIEGATINQGTKAGIREGMAVVNGSGVVGQIVAASHFSSKILFITDRSSGADALLQSVRTRGILRGRGAHKCVLEYVDAQAQVVEGERVITSGLDGVYPKGVLIGLVSKITKAPDGLFYSIQVDPVVDLARLEEVKVLLEQRAEGSDLVTGTGAGAKSR